MSKWSDATKAVALNAVAAVSTHLALFNGDPLDGGTELSSASYARQAISFPTATNGTVLAAESPVFQLRADDSATHLAIMNALTVGTSQTTRPNRRCNYSFGCCVGDTPFTVSSVTLRLNNTV